MKREIKFRAWDKSLKKMSNPFNLFELEGYEGEVNAVVHNEEYEQWTISINGFADEDIVLQQYTGLKDKNSVEIYEGDLVRYDLGKREQQMGADRYEYGKVVFEYGAFQVVTDDGCMDLLCDGGQEPTVEVIGNIYEK